MLGGRRTSVGEDLFVLEHGAELLVALEPVLSWTNRGERVKGGELELNIGSLPCRRLGAET